MPKAPSSTPMVSIQRPCYAMASTDGQSADITMYGQIVDTQPTDWWTGEPIPGQYIIESEFLSDLQQVEHCSEITIRMDSVGWVMYSASAAAVMVPCCTTAQNVSISRLVILPPPNYKFLLIF